MNFKAIIQWIGPVKHSRAKIWIRTGLLTIFSIVFGIPLFRDIHSGLFYGALALGIFLAAILIGYQMRGLVPMRVVEPGAVALSLDKVYFVLIWILVIVKFVSANVFKMTFLPDVLMCSILGIMSGRLSGICLRVRDLKIQKV
jgi:hypothetical protein